jgi:predicted DNA-binding protein
MHIDLTPEEESRLAALASREGLTAHELAVNLPTPYLHDQEDFIRAVE